MTKTSAKTKPATTTKARVATMQAANGKRIKLDWRTRYRPGSVKWKLAEETEAKLTGGKVKAATKAAKAKPAADVKVVMPDMPEMAVVIPAEVVASAMLADQPAAF